MQASFLQGLSLDLFPIAQYILMSAGVKLSSAS